MYIKYWIGLAALGIFVLARRGVPRSLARTIVGGVALSVGVAGALMAAILRLADLG